LENKPTDDEYWIKRIPIDPSAFEVIYDRYLLQVYRYIYRKVGNQAEAEDLTSIVFLHALEGILKGQYASRNKFLAWLFSIVRIKTADHFRERKRMPIVSFDDELEPTDGHEITPGDLRGLSKCYSGLSSSEQELLALRFSADLDFKTIALILHKNTAAVKMATYRSLDKLRKRMEGSDE